MHQHICADHKHRFFFDAELSTEEQRASSVTMHQVMAHTHTTACSPNLCRAQYCRVSSTICCYAARSRSVDSTSWLDLKLYILNYFLLSLHKLSIKYYFYIHTPPSKGHKMLNERNTKGTFSEEDINGLKVKVLPN
jgi:hypothetical protein